MARLTPTRQIPDSFTLKRVFEPHYAAARTGIATGLAPPFGGDQPGERDAGPMMAITVAVASEDMAQILQRSTERV